MTHSAAGAVALVVVLIFASPVSAQSINFASGNQDLPIDITADNGIEWQQDNQLLIARGNAHATRAGVNVYSDLMRAYYEREQSGGSHLKRVDAVGKVRILSDQESIDGDGAVYDMEKAILVVSGKKVTYKSASDMITADQQMEYYENDQKAVARGNAVAVHEGKTLNASVVEAYFRQNAAKKTEVYEVRAFDNVTIVTDQDTVRANKGIYNVATGLATLVGDVKITRGQNQLDGDQAEINMNTGVSRLLTAPGAGSGSGRVRGLIQPQQKSDSAKGKAKSKSQK